MTRHSTRNPSTNQVDWYDVAARLVKRANAERTPAPKTPEELAVIASHLEALEENEARASVAYWEKEAGNMDKARRLWKKEAEAMQTVTLELAHREALAEDVKRNFCADFQKKAAAMREADEISEDDLEAAAAFMDKYGHTEEQ